MAFNIWRFTDDKSGHDSQSTALCTAIEKLKSSERFDIPVDSFLDSLKHLLFKQFPQGKDLPDPDIIIGAGHGTHFPMLSARHARKGKIIVLMKPSLPLSFFDYCIIPKHDLSPENENVIATAGALNPVQFNENNASTLGLILLGGPSRHYQWDSKSIINQIVTIVTTNSHIRWAIADSPRTPTDTLTTISELGLENIGVLRHDKTDMKQVHDLIFKAKNVWVSMDSISMIYESLSSGASVGLLEIPQKQKNRISNSINILINENRLTTFSTWKNTNVLAANTIKFNEAERCAKLLLERGALN